MAVWTEKTKQSQQLIPTPWVQPERLVQLARQAPQAG